MNRYCSSNDNDNALLFKISNEILFINNNDNDILFL